MRFASTLFFLLLNLSALPGQEIRRITTTDSSVIETIIVYDTNKEKRVYTSKLIEEKINKRNLIHSISYFFNDTTTVQEEDYRRIDDYSPTGISRLYNKDGSLKMIIDEDKQAWYPSDTNQYPNYSILLKMKLKGDSIVRSIYGQSFFKHYIKWNMVGSYYFCRSSFSVEWIRDDTKNKYENPTEFNLVYDIIYDTGKCSIYEPKKLSGAIKLIFNSEGNFLPSHKCNYNCTIYNSGLEKVADTSHLRFQITKQKAIESAYKHGLKRNKDTVKLQFELRWESAKDSQNLVYNGHFKMALSQLIKNKKKKTKQGNEYVNIYKLWIFNPWSGELVEKKKVHRNFRSYNIFGTPKKTKSI